jgi:hypothetical protein
MHSFAARAVLSNARKRRGLGTPSQPPGHGGALAPRSAHPDAGPGFLTEQGTDTSSIRVVVRAAASLFGRDRRSEIDLSWRGCSAGTAARRRSDKGAGYRANPAENRPDRSTGAGADTCAA